MGRAYAYSYIPVGTYVCVLYCRLWAGEIGLFNRDLVEHSRRGMLRMFASFFFSSCPPSFSVLSYFDSLFVFFFLFFLSSLIFRVQYITIDIFLVIFVCEWYGMVYHSSLVPCPLRTGMMLPCAPFRTCLFSPIDMLFCRSLFRDHRQEFRDVS